MKKELEKIRKGKPTALVRRKRQERIRLVIQLLFFLTIPSVYTAAFNGIKTTARSIGNGNSLEWNAFIIQLLIVCGITILAGRFFCGWVCAFGLINDLIFRSFTGIMKILKRKNPGIPRNLIQPLQKMKYLVLLGIIIICFFQKSEIIAPNSPWTAFSFLTNLNIHMLETCSNGVILLLLLIPGMALQERFFCQFFCPMGAVFSLLPQIPLFQLERKKNNCPEKCGACQKVCPVNILINKDNPLQGECIRCNKCKYICPRNLIL